MDLNLKKNLFRFGKNESLTFGAIIALFFFDILVWCLISKGMISVDYRFSDNNNCFYMLHDIQSYEIGRQSYPKWTGKYCAALQREYAKTLADDTVSKYLKDIQQTQSTISDLQNKIYRERRTLDQNATAYGLAIQEQKGLDLSYTEKLAKVQNLESTLEATQKTLEQQRQSLRTTPAVQKLVQYAGQNYHNVQDRYDFMRKLDLFLTYVFAMIFVLILIPIFWFFRKKLLQNGKYIRLLLVNHIIFVAILQACYITVCFILRILPKTLLYHLVRFFQSLHLMALWYYIAIALLFALFAGIVYFLQTKGRRRNLYKKLIKGKCWNCGARVLDNEFCFSCGEKQLDTCSHCHKKTYIKMPYCRYCGKPVDFNDK